MFDAPETVDGARLPKHGFATLAHVLMKAAETCPDTKITYLEDANTRTSRSESYADLMARARRIANGLRQQGLRRGIWS